MNTIALLSDGVKKVAKRTWEKVTAATLTQLLDLPEFKVSHMDNEGEVLHLKCDYHEAIAQCPGCCELSWRIHQSEKRQVRDMSLLGKRVILHFLQRRFVCERCGRPFTEVLPSIDRWRRQTRRYEGFIYEQCLISTRKAVAQQEHLSESTVKEIFVKWAKRATQRAQVAGVRVLGIDEISLKKRHKQYALVLSDLEKHCILAVLPDRKKKTLVGWLKNLPADERRAIQVVSTDLWEPYRQAVQEVLPHVQQVADRYHVMKQLNDRLTQARRALQRQADEKTRAFFKGSRWLLVKARNDLSAEEEIQLQALLDVSPELRSMYLLKEEFRFLCDKIRDRDQATRFLRAWILKAQITGNKYLLKFVKTLQRWWSEFLNYFLERITQAFIEGINNAIRTLIRCAYGFRNFDLFRLHVLALHGSP